MPAKKRHATRYPGVSFIESTNPATGEAERVYYIRYRRNGRMVEEKAGRPSLNDMTAAKASQMRSDRMTGKEVSNRERREADKAEKNKMTVGRIWEKYKKEHENLSTMPSDKSRWTLKNLSPTKCLLTLSLWTLTGFVPSCLKSYPPKL